MIRRDAAYWQRLRKDRASNLAGVCAVIATLAAAVSVTVALIDGNQAMARGNPLYWLVLVPVAWWASSLLAFEPWAVRVWKPVLAIACLASLTCLYGAVMGGGSVTPNMIGTAIVVTFAAASVLAYRTSLVAKEGPAR